MKIVLSCSQTLTIDLILNKTLFWQWWIIYSYLYLCPGGGDASSIFICSLRNHSLLMCSASVSKCYQTKWIHGRSIRASANDEELKSLAKMSLAVNSRDCLRSSSVSESFGHDLVHFSLFRELCQEAVETLSINRIDSTIIFLWALGPRSLRFNQFGWIHKWRSQEEGQPSLTRENFRLYTLTKVTTWPWQPWV